MAKYRCMNCNYSFDASFSDLCPNCGEKGTLNEEKSAEELVDEAEF